ncbi:hypothetical protein [Paraburkholderia strydomiana]|uniref:hypothetical protein n=1 Tax=Paraburkholderia strydomiana TaxID=1245417 RepID=UPI001BE5E7C7|nr:hypothetical protein [Paraburkholderia strydomiana]MBT2790111.1 hypothetical protein [Paraburkholderia strydomiana]
MYGGMDTTGGPFAKQARATPTASEDRGATDSVPRNCRIWSATRSNNTVCSEVGTTLEKTPGDKAFEYEKRVHQSIQNTAPMAFDAVHIIVAPMRRSNSANSAKVLAAMRPPAIRASPGKIQSDSRDAPKQGVVSLYRYDAAKKTLITSSDVSGCCADTIQLNWTLGVTGWPG